MKTLGLCLCLILLMGAGLAQSQDPDPLIQQGKEVFSGICADCHRANGEGLPTVFPALNKNHFVLGDPSQVIATVLNGRKGKMGIMPTWKDKLDDAQIAGAVTYIRQAWENKAPGVTPDLVASIRKK
jgi:mono/diheme cytochrome c family protein